VLDLTCVVHKSQLGSSLLTQWHRLTGFMSAILGAFTPRKCYLNHSGLVLFTPFLCWKWSVCLKSSRVKGLVASLEEVGHWGHAFEGYVLSPDPFLLSASWPPWGEQFHSVMCPHHDALPVLGLKGNRAGHPWTESSEIVSRHKPFFL
jgi:hypothetical protein